MAPVSTLLLMTLASRQDLLYASLRVKSVDVVEAISSASINGVWWDMQMSDERVPPLPTTDRLRQRFNDVESSQPFHTTTFCTVSVWLEVHWLDCENRSGS